MGSGYTALLYTGLGYKPCDRHICRGPVDLRTTELSDYRFASQFGSWLTPRTVKKSDRSTKTQPQVAMVYYRLCTDLLRETTKSRHSAVCCSMSQIREQSSLHHGGRWCSSDASSQMHPPVVSFVGSGLQYPRASLRRQSFFPDLHASEYIEKAEVHSGHVYL